MQLLINDETTNKIFPFSFIINEDLEFVFTGKSLGKLIPGISENTFDKVFHFVRPHHARNSFDSIKEFLGQIFILRSMDSKENLLFRGEFIEIDSWLMFLGSPWLTDPQDLRRFSLKLKDFALHDPITDLLQVMQVRMIAAEEVKTLNKLLEKNEKKYRHIVETAHDIIFNTDEYGTFTYVNPVGLRKFNKSEDEVIGHNFSEFVDKVEGVYVERFYNYMKEEKLDSTYFEFPMKLSSGEILWLGQNVKSVTDENGKITSFIGVARDVTERKIFEKSLIEARKKAEAAQEAEKQFLAKMSHEIRTPLNAVLGMTYLLKETPLTSEQNEYIDILQSSGDILHNLISDILDVSKINAGEANVVKAPFDVYTLCKSLVDSFKFQLKEKGLTISLLFDRDLPAKIMGDKMLLNQILINLLSNASKFTHEGSIELSVSQTVLNNKPALRFKVSDTGIGIPDDKMDAIFKSFVQAGKETSRIYGGTGLGLTIVKQLTELQQGVVHIKSNVNEGTVFTVDIPYDTIDAHKNTDPVGIKEQSGLENISILIAEDNVMNQKFITRLLEQWQIRFDIANNGREAVELAKQAPYDIILMDIQMPEMDGYAATYRIRSDNSNPNQNTPIIALTASALKEYRDDALKAGMNDFVGKPFKPSNLRRVLSSIITDNKTGQEKSTVLEFHKDLDAEYLETFYENDAVYAAEMFGLFIDDTYPEFLGIEHSLRTHNGSQARKTIHKIGPTFKMVGLSSFHAQLMDLKEMIKTDRELPQILQEYDRLKETLDNFMKIIHLENERLKRMKPVST